MAHEIKIPAVGESISSATIGTWHKKDGDYVKSGEVILTIETDKISTELESDEDGVLRHLAGEGDELEIGAAVARIEEGEAPAEEDSDEDGEDSGDGSGAEQEEGEGSDEGESREAAESPAAEEKSEEETEPAQDVKATPVARKIAADEGIDLGGISGTGAGGKIVKADVVEASAGSSDQEPEPAQKGEQQDEAPVLSVVENGGESQGDGKPETRRKMSPLRRKIATHLVNAQQESAILTTFNECDMSAVMELRKRIQDDFVERHGIKLGFMSFFIKAVVDALQAVPGLNARIEGDEIVENHYYDIGVAVGTDRGLVVPVIRDCDDRSFAQIEKDIVDYATRARDNKIDLSDLQGGVFTITNGGIYGSLLSTPILNPPQSGILGMHSIQERPVARDGEVVIRPMMYLAVSYDHRIVDGKEAVTFLVRVKECIENPERMLVGA